MLDAEAIANQQALLAIYRRTLANLLKQAAQYGGELFAPPVTAAGIYESRAQIRQIKGLLRANGLPATDQPSDEPGNTTLDESVRTAPALPPAISFQGTEVPACPYKGLSAFTEQDAPFFMDERLLQIGSSARSNINRWLL